MRMHKHSRKITVVAFLGAVAGVAMFSGCVRSRVYVLDAPSPEPMSIAPRGMTLRQGEHAVKMCEKEIAVFEAAIAEAYRDQTGSGRVGVLTTAPSGSSDLELVYRFVSLDEGDGSVRVVSGVAGLFGSPFYALGDGDIGVEAVFEDAGRRPLARVVCSGPISGMFSGRKDGLEAAAKALAQYAVKHFPVDADDASASAGAR